MIITWFAAILTLAQAASTIGFDPIVATKTALLTGTSEETPLGAVNKFLGVPYAKAPTGKNISLSLLTTKFLTEA